MREIKFRAWTKEEMIYEGWNNNFFVNKEIIFRFDNVMQYTGLKDKNGKEIYEGDLVKHKERNRKWEPLDDDSPLEIETTSTVEWRDRGYWLTNESFGWEGEDIVNWDNLEVIGNIYENPELITHNTLKTTE